MGKINIGYMTEAAYKELKENSPTALIDFNSKQPEELADTKISKDNMNFEAL